MQDFANFETLVERADAEARTRVGQGLRPLQREVLRFLAAGRNTFAGLPTGYGKSLCFWAPAAAWGWRVWVVSPLVSLMEDQAMACASLGVAAVALHSGLATDERRAREARLWEENPVVFLSPERLTLWQENGTLERIRAAGRAPQLLALDEMHCFEDWREFRLSYQDSFAAIRGLIARGAVLLGLSASLSVKASAAWMEEFGGAFEAVRTELGRENLMLRVIAIEEECERWMTLISVLRETSEGESTLLYCSTREECDALARWLASAGYPACTYHAGVPAAIREARSRDFRAGRLRFLCATSAFGMGIDFPRVRRVIHFSTPYDLESYWQEAGRAGRDGEPAYAIAFWRRSDVSRGLRMSERQKEKFFSLWAGWFSGRCRKCVVGEILGLDEKPCGRCDICDPAGEAEGHPAWLREASNWRNRPAWWTEAAAQGEPWAREKIFGPGKNLDGVSFPDSVSFTKLNNNRDFRAERGLT